ncbi:hypothetical protein HN51_062450, partial [Arachis hypogaea]
MLVTTKRGATAAVDCHWRTHHTAVLLLLFAIGVEHGKEINSAVVVNKCGTALRNT